MSVTDPIFQQAGGQGRKTRLGVKYCGGCNPEFDRVEMVRQIASRLAERVELVSWQDPVIDGLLIVAGCQTACVELQKLPRLKTYWLIGRTGVEALLDRLERGENPFVTTATAGSDCRAS